MFVFTGKIKIKVNEIGEGIFLKEKDFSLEAYKLFHGASCLGYVFKENDKRRIDKRKIRKLRLPGKLIGILQKGKNIKFKGKLIKSQDISYIQKGKKISFIFDTRVCDGCYKIARNADILIAESTYGSEMKDLAYKYKHLTTEQIANIAKKSNVKELIITHISQRYEKNPDLILKEVKRIFKKTRLAEDFMKINI